jgi:hypothetical protein
MTERSDETPKLVVEYSGIDCGSEEWTARVNPDGSVTITAPDGTVSIVPPWRKDEP